MSDSEENGWSGWSKVVLSELKRLNENYIEIDDKMDFIKIELIKVKSVWNSIKEFKEWKKNIEDKAIIQKVEEIYDWKNNMDDIWSVPQMKEIRCKVEKMESRWTVIITIWAVVQFIIGILLVFKDKIF